ncbi:MAG: 23S rRNA (adenine(2503)-C(2))-methyltransferase RlmN [Myxococcota bacterium]
MSIDLLGLPFPQLRTFLDEIGVGEHHAGRVFRGLHHHDQALSDIDDLGRHAARIAASSHIASAVVREVHANPDGTQKLVVELVDGKRVEAVLVPMRDDRWTLCVSSQVGCAMACTFCATGTLGLARSLTAGEIVAQVMAAVRQSKTTKRRISRLVFMGMGEPLHNYEAVRDAIFVLLDDHGQSFGSKHITVSTVGLIKRLAQLAEDTKGRIQLAISLHAGTDETRRQIVPTGRTVTIKQLKDAVHAWPLPGSRAVMVEVVVLPGVNDGPADLDGIADFMVGLRGVVNLIPFNPFPGSPFTPPQPDQVLTMQRRLQDRGVRCNVRWPRGREVSGACGQLMLAHATPSSDGATAARE